MFLIVLDLGDDSKVLNFACCDQIQLLKGLLDLVKANLLFTALNLA